MWRLLVLGFRIRLVAVFDRRDIEFSMALLVYHRLVEEGLVCKKCNLYIEQCSCILLAEALDIMTTLLQMM